MSIAAIDFQLLANAGFPPARFAAGDVIFAKGDKGDKTYVIRSGEVEIEQDGKVVETLSSGAGIFGEWH
jgi:CRP/FNR family cyclic AMP-dependent transcriptional regulator